MNALRQLHALLAGGAIAATLVGCGDEKTQRDSAPTPASGAVSTPAADPGKPTEATKPAAEAPAPAVIDQPAAPTATPADAAKDKPKAGAGEVKKETPPSAH